MLRMVRIKRNPQAASKKTNCPRCKIPRDAQRAVPLKGSGSRPLIVASTASAWRFYQGVSNNGRREAGFAERRHTILALLIHSEGDGAVLKKLLWWPVLLRYFIARQAGTPATLTRRCGGPNPALQASRSCQLQRRCERTARGGRGGGKISCWI